MVCVESVCTFSNRKRSGPSPRPRPRPHPLPGPARGCTAADAAQGGLVLPRCTFKVTKGEQLFAAVQQLSHWQGGRCTALGQVNAACRGLERQQRRQPRLRHRVQLFVSLHLGVHIAVTRRRQVCHAGHSTDATGTSLRWCSKGGGGEEGKGTMQQHTAVDTATHPPPPLSSR
jgi:hypothetical protein